MRDDTVITAVIFDRGRAGVVGLSANAGDEEREDHLELGVEEECTCGVGGAPAEAAGTIRWHVLAAQAGSERAAGSGAAGSSGGERWVLQTRVEL